MTDKLNHPTHRPGPHRPGPDPQFAANGRRFGAVVSIVCTEQNGAVVAERAVGNAVLQSGATLMAELFRGGLAGPITHMSVGANPTPEIPPFVTAALAVSHPETGELIGERDVTVGPDDFTVAPDPDRRQVIVEARIVLPGSAGGLAGPVAEAALVHISDDGTRSLYNRVTFEPIEKRPDQELSLYWEIFFPFGDSD